jgi:hypothetical protein
MAAEEQKTRGLICNNCREVKYPKDCRCINISNEPYPRDRWAITCRACGTALGILETVEAADAFFGKGLRPKEPAPIIPPAPSPLSQQPVQETILEKIGPSEPDVQVELEEQ